MKHTKTLDLLVVSNRLPVSIHRDKANISVQRTTGGLASALEGARRKTPFSWIGWPGKAILKKETKEVTELLKKQDLIPIFLSEKDEQHYYHGICNTMLWPLFHYFTDRVHFTQENWFYYEKVNQQFAKQVIQNATKGATVWIHDFHLMLLPEILRKKRPDLKIGFFLHIPFPSSEIYRTLPNRRELLQGLLGSDYIGFHTNDYVRHFRASCLRILGVDSTSDVISSEGRSIGIGVHPIGIDVLSFSKTFKLKKTKDYFLGLKRQFNKSKVILGVERLDYTKGIQLKFQAFERFLEKYQKEHPHVLLLQAIVPSRLDVTDYQSLKRDIEEMVGKINGRFSVPGFTPVSYLYRVLKLFELSALYHFADVGLVTPLRDGMNLVAQEFVYCQMQSIIKTQRKTSGMLILSEFAGSAQSLSRALLVNPQDVEKTADAIYEALEMDKKEKEDRINSMCEKVIEMDSPKWALSFLKALEVHAKDNHEKNSTRILKKRNITQLLRKAQKAKERVIILDYDGTLREFTKNPHDATPTKELLTLLEKLTKLEKTKVHIVSGRDHKTLQKWLGHLKLTICAEHGYTVKAPGSKWKSLQKVNLDWIPFVKRLLERTVNEVPGSLLETKNCSLAWHYRMSDLDYGEWRAKELRNALEDQLSNLPVEILSGNKLLEVRAQGVTKGFYVEKLMEKANKNTFILCMGDDRTDQDMYRVLPHHAISIHVGAAHAKTHFVLESPQKVRDFLHLLCTSLNE